MSIDMADFNARQDIVKRLPEREAEEFRAYRLSVPEFMVKDDLIGHALRAAFDAITEAHRRMDAMAVDFREKSEAQSRWRDEEIARGRSEIAVRFAGEVAELARLREVVTVIRRASIEGRKTLRVADLTAVIDQEMP